jgi:CHASE3 domain sensor protein
MTAILILILLMALTFVIGVYEYYTTEKMNAELDEEKAEFLRRMKVYESNKEKGNK